MSNQIKMNPELMPLIRNKIKTATTRKGIKKVHLGDCEIVNNQNSTDVISGFIHKIEIIRFKDISLELAEIENYHNPEELKKKLIEIYGPITDEQFMTIIYFNIN